MNNIDLSIVIVNYKVKDLVVRSVQSIQKFTKDLSYEIFVLENDSGDDSVPVFQNAFGSEPNIHIIDNGANLGFGKAQNIGILESRGKYVCILNPDTELHENSFKILFDWMEKPEHQKVGFVGPKIVFPDMRLQSSVKRFPDVLSQVFVLLKMHHLFPHFGSVRRYLAKDMDYGKEQPVDQIMGAVMFARGNVLREKLEGFDEDFWIWFEDVDICKRMKRISFENYYTPITSVIHHEGKSFGQVLAPKKQRFFNRSLRTYARKHFGYSAYVLFTLLHPVSMALSYIVALLKIKPRPQSRV